MNRTDKRRNALTKVRNSKMENANSRVVHGFKATSALAVNGSRRFIAAFLALVFAISCMVVGVNFATKADDPIATVNHSLIPKGEKGEKNDVSGMVLNKYLTPKDNGNYDLTLEAYATAEVKPIIEKIPTDFVVVVDQSGSMGTSDMPTGNPTVQNNKYLEDVANGNYYFKDGDNYYRVYGVRDYMMEYHAGNTLWTQDIVNASDKGLRWFQSESEGNFDVENQYYFKDNSGIYRPITVTIAGKALRYEVKFRYVDANNNIIYFHYPDKPAYKPWATVGIINIRDPYTDGQTGYATANAAVKRVFSSNDTSYTYATVLGWLTTGMYIDKPMYTRHLGYNKLCYRDVNGVEHEVPSNANGGQTTWEYCDSDGYARSGEASNSARPTYSGLYTYQTTTDRLTALKAALNEFALAVAKETDDFGAVDNRISIVGFSSTNSSTTHDPDYRTNRNYNNTELLTHIERDIDSSSTNGWQKAECDNNVSEYYGKGLVGATNGTIGTVNSKITNAIRAITANGGTQPEDGLNMAYQVLTNRGTGEGKDTYKIRSGAKIGQSVNRNTIVIFFTDGQPGNYHESDQYAEANEVVAQAKYIKDYGASLFSIGVFGESDGNPLTYADTSQQQSERNDWKYLGGWMETYYDGSYYCLRREWRPSNDDYTATPNDTIFDYMSVVSSNYPDAKNYIAPAWLTGNFDGNYIAATDGDAVRQKSTAELTNKYYRMASNQATLVAAFLQAVTMNNEQSDPEPVPASSIELKDTISDYFSVKLDSENNPSIKYYTQQGEMGADGLGDFSNYSPVEITNPGEGFNSETNTLTVKGFDFSGEYIASDKTGVNAGRKLIVIVKDVTPNSDVTTKLDNNQNVIPLYSNKDGAGINIIGDDGSKSSIGEFPSPYISRHSYTLDVGSENTSGQFNVVSTIVDSNGTAVLANDPALSDVIVVAPGGTRSLYSSSGGTSVAKSVDGDVFYYENVPTGYLVKTEIISTDDAYKYTWTDNANVTLDQTTAQTKNYEYKDSTISIESVANTRSASLTLTTQGEYANTQREFPIGMTITKSDGTELTGFTGDITLGDGNKLSFKDGSLVDPNSLKLKHGATVTFTNLPANWNVTITPSEDSAGFYTWTTSVDGSTPTESSATKMIDQNGYAFAVVYTRGEVTDSGILDNSDSQTAVLYVLAGMTALAAGGAGCYGYWKRKEQ